LGTVTAGAGSDEDWTRQQEKVQSSLSRMREIKAAWLAIAG
jgi:hypothetical protein